MVFVSSSTLLLSFVVLFQTSVMVNGFSVTTTKKNSIVSNGMRRQRNHLVSELKSTKTTTSADLVVPTGAENLAQDSTAASAYAVVLDKDVTKNNADIAAANVGFLSGLWVGYNRALDEKPILTKAMTSLVGWSLGDLIAQIALSSPSDGGGVFDTYRFVTISLFGLLYHGPSGHFFYNKLDEIIPGTDGLSVAKKIAIDQLFWCPIFVCVYFTYLGVVNGDLFFPTISTKISTDLLSTCQGSWKLWPLVHFINFKFISNKHRLLYLNTVQVGFNVFLSIVGSK